MGRAENVYEYHTKEEMRLKKDSTKLGKGYG
jgi:hypothetical protein